MKRIKINKQQLTINETTLKGKKYYTLPVTLIKEGVHKGSAGAILHKAEELAKSYFLYNGIVVTLGHPVIDNNFVSANIPEVFEKYYIGRLFNVRYENGALKGTIYLDKDIIDNDYYYIIDYITNNETDVSIGDFHDIIWQKGRWGNEDYDGIAMNYRPDHLAILVDEVGACSYADGCGIRVNKDISFNAIYTAKLEVPDNLQLINNQSKEDNAMSKQCEAKICQLLKANKKLTEADKEWLAQLTEEQLDKLIVNTDELVKSKISSLSLSELKDYLNDEVKKQIEESVKTYEQKRNELIENVLKVHKAFKREDIEKFDNETLEKMSVIDIADYSGKGSNKTDNKVEILEIKE